METFLFLIILLQLLLNLTVFLTIILHIYTNGLPDVKKASVGIRGLQVENDDILGEDYGAVDVVDVVGEELDRTGQREVDELMNEQLHRMEEENFRDPYR